jgi:hypothetical protein
MVTIHMTAHLPGIVQAKPGKLPVMCIVTITLPVQRQENERSCVLLPFRYLYKARKMTWLCTGSVIVKIHITAHLPGFVQVM